MPSPTAPRGMFEAVVTGYHLAWARRGRLLSVQLPILAVMFTASLLLDLIPGRDGVAVVDHVLSFTGEPDAVTLARTALAALCSLLALLAGTLALATETGDHPIKAAARQLPITGIGIVLVAAVSFALIWILPNLVGAGLFVTVLGLGSARLLLEPVVPHPTWRATASVLIGGLALVLPLGYVVDLWAVPPVLAAPAAAFTLIVLLAGLAGVIAANAGAPETATKSRLWPATAAVVTPLLLAGGVAIANPYGAPVVRTHQSSTGGAEAIAWPAGQHPVIVTWADVRFCDTDLCDRYTSQSGGPAVWDGYGTAGIGPDGTVVKASISSGGQNGGPFAHYARCTRDGCPEAWLPVRADAREEYDAEGGHVELAVNAAPDGSLWFFVAMPIPAAGKKAGTESDTEPNGRYRLKLIRCPDPTCKTPEYHDAGTIDRTPGDGYQDGRRARLSLSPDGRPLASLWIGWSVEQVTCDPTTCGNLRRVHAEAGPPSAVWATPAVAGRPVASLEGGLLRSGGGETFQFSQTSGTAGAVVTDGDLVYLTGAVPAERPPGNLTFRITLGTPPEYRRQTLWRCAGGDCHGTPLDVYEGPAQRQMLVPGPDGRVLIVRADRTLLVESL